MLTTESADQITARFFASADCPPDSPDIAEQESTQMERRNALMCRKIRKENEIMEKMDTQTGLLPTFRVDFGQWQFLELTHGGYEQRCTCKLTGITKVVGRETRKSLPHAHFVLRDGDRIDRQMNERPKLTGQEVTRAYWEEHYDEYLKACAEQGIEPWLLKPSPNEPQGPTEREKTPDA